MRGNAAAARELSLLDGCWLVLFRAGNGRRMERRRWQFEYRIGHTQERVWRCQPREEIAAADRGGSRTRRRDRQVRNHVIPDQLRQACCSTAARRRIVAKSKAVISGELQAASIRLQRICRAMKDTPACDGAPLCREPHGDALAGAPGIRIDESIRRSRRARVQDRTPTAVRARAFADGCFPNIEVMSLSW